MHNLPPAAALRSDINTPVSPGTPGVFEVAVDGEVAADGEVAVDGAVEGAVEGTVDGLGDTPKIVGDGAPLGDVEGADDGDDGAGDWLTLPEGDVLGAGVGVGVPLGGWTPIN